ncbi:MAG: kelch repeat-containing protein [Anaerolineae bacterium]
MTLPAPPGFRLLRFSNARAGHAAITLPDGRVLVVGGCFGSQASGAVSSPGQPWDVQAMAEVYDPRANSWQAAGELAEGRCWPTATLLADGRVLVVGGSDRTGQPVAGAELYDPLPRQLVIRGPAACGARGAHGHAAA